jgi:hypothetical protein
MALSFSEKRTLQKTVADNLVKLDSRNISFSEKRTTQKAVADALAKLTGNNLAANEPDVNIPEQGFAIGDRVVIVKHERMGEHDITGRTGTIVKPHFDGWYVELDKTPREKTAKVQLILTNLSDKLEKIEDENNLIPEGKEIQVASDNGKKTKIKFTVVEADKLIISHDEEGNANPNYPPELQPRDRKKETSIAQILKIANDPDPGRLGETKSTSIGAPIIGKDRVVESGNGRAAGIKLAYKKGKADEYREWLTEMADYFKISKSKVKSMKKPVLVRVRTTEMTLQERIEFTIDGGKSEQLAMTASENARSDAKLITDEMLAKFYPESSLTSQVNRDFVLSFIEKLGNSETANYVVDVGYSKQLYDRIQAGLFSKAYNDDRLLALMSENTDKEGMANIIAALNQAAPSFVRARSISHKVTGQITGKVSEAVELSLDDKAINALIEATKILKTAKESSMELEEFLKQGMIFEGDVVTPVIAQMAIFIKENNRSANRMGTAFQTMAEFVADELERRQNNALWVDDPEIDLLDVLKSANEQLKKQFGDKVNTIGGGTGGFVDMFTSTRGQEKDRQAFLEQNKHIEMLKAVIAGDYDSEDSTPLLDRIETAANGVDSTFIRIRNPKLLQQQLHENDNIVGQAMDKWLELDNKNFALDSAEDGKNKTIDWDKVSLDERIAFAVDAGLDESVANKKFSELTEKEIKAINARLKDAIGDGYNLKDNLAFDSVMEQLQGLGFEFRSAA